MVRFADEMDSIGMLDVADIVTKQAERIAQTQPPIPDWGRSLLNPQAPERTAPGMCPSYARVHQRLADPKSQVGGLLVEALFTAPNVVRCINPHYTLAQAKTQVGQACARILAAMGITDDMTSTIDYMLQP